MPGRINSSELNTQHQRITGGADIFVAPITDDSSVSPSPIVADSVNTSEMSGSSGKQKTLRKTEFPQSSVEYARRESNPQPSDLKSGATSIEPTKRQRVKKRRSRRCTTGCTNSPENEHSEAVDGSVVSQSESLPIKADSFSAALAMISSLPLSDAEKADAVRRLMAEQAGSPEKSHGGSHAVR